MDDVDLEVQTRSEENGIHIYHSFDEAMNAAKIDPTIWKISFAYGKERIRLVKYVDDQHPLNGAWIYEPLHIAGDD